MLVLMMICLDLTPKTKARKCKNKQVALLGLKASSQQRKLSAKIKRRHTRWEKLQFANHISDKGVDIKIYKEQIQLNSKNK